MTIFAVISGAESWEDIEDFGETHLDFLKQYGDFENGIPVHDTIARVVSCISPAKFHECFINWMRDCHSSDDKDVIAIDGKTLRHSYDKSRRRGAIHVISAFSTMHSLVIGQIKTDDKSNEITAIPELLNMLDIKGKIITTDAMGCQKDIAEKIQKQGGDYLFAVKGNQGWLNKAFEEKFPLKELNNPEHDSYAICEKSHGREEIRIHIVCDVPDELIDFTFEWKGLKNSQCVLILLTSFKRSTIMPHIDIKCFPRELDEQQKAALAADITDVIIRHLNSKDSSISIALQQIQPESWQAIWDAEIAPQMEALIKKPGYSM